ncbi:N-acetyltransferase [Micromonospora sp. CA-263727]|uniref:N-acetyltransferase n=1 Tax=Micromonospora sp. CA-263727 TaxID=3239967 RepID=UPI003D89B141
MRLVESAVRRATGDDAAALSVLLADALLSQRLGAWLVPDAAERPGVLQRYARFVVAQGLAHGQVDTTSDRAAVAIWYSRPARPPTSPAWMFELHRVLGGHAARFGLLHAYVDAVYPHTAHYYLAHLAVAAGGQGGVGSAVVAGYHRRVDVAGLPSYVEVSTDRPREGLLGRLGYVPRSPIMLEPGGPVLWRMWRPPAHGGRHGEASGDELPRRARAWRSATPFRGAVLLTASSRSP